MKIKLIILACVTLHLTSCKFFTDTAYPVHWGMAKGKVIEWRGKECYMLDLGSIYKPERETVIFIGAIGIDHLDRTEWVIEADIEKLEFVRGIGAKPFPKWPDETINKVFEIIRSTNTDDSENIFEHPFKNLTKEERIEFIYSSSFDPQMFLESVQYWAKMKAKQ